VRWWYDEREKNALVRIGGTPTDAAPTDARVYVAAAKPSITKIGRENGGNNNETRSGRVGESSGGRIVRRSSVVIRSEFGRRNTYARGHLSFAGDSRRLGRRENRTDIVTATCVTPTRRLMLRRTTRSAFFSIFARVPFDNVSSPRQ